MKTSVILSIAILFALEGSVSAVAVADMCHFPFYLKWDACSPACKESIKAQCKADPLKSSNPMKAHFDLQKCDCAMSKLNLRLPSPGPGQSCEMISRNYSPCIYK